MADVRIKIADIVVGLSGACMPEGPFPGHFHSFITGAQKKDLSLRVIEQPVGAFSSGRLVFSSGPQWRMVAAGDRFCLDLFSEDFGSVPYKSCVFDRGLTQGEIYLNPEARPLRLIDVPFEYPLDELLYILLFSRYSGFLMHASGIAYDKAGGCLFCGHSGAGKSTMAKFWRLSGRGVLLNDDRVVIRKMAEGFFIFGTPWCGEIKECRPDGVPLKRVFFLKKAGRPHLRKMLSDEAVARSLATSFLPFWDNEAMACIMDTMSDLAHRVDFFELEFSNDPGVLDFIGDSL